VKPAVALLALLFALPWPLDRLRDQIVPEWVDRYLYNPRERSERAVEAYAAEDWEAAAEHAERALRAAPPRAADENVDGEPSEPPPDPRLAYNAGTARLAAGGEKRAVDRLQQAVAAIDAGEAADLAFAARYNLGNAKLAVDDAAGAVAAFKQALRLEPGDAAAKHNLELALARLEEQNELPFKPPQESPDGRSDGEQERGDSGGSDSPADEPRDDAGSADPGAGDAPGPQQQRPQPPSPGGEEQPGEQRPLPRFEDQPDMSAEQAAALLEAVENLERRQRQTEAAERARRSSRGGKDW